MVPPPSVPSLNMSRFLDADEVEILSAGAKHRPGANSPLAGAFRWLAGRNTTTPREAILVLRKRFLHAIMVPRRRSTDSSPLKPLSPRTDFTNVSPSPVARHLQLPPSLRVGSSEGGTSQCRSSPSRTVSWDTDIEEVCNFPERKQDAPPFRPRGYGLQHDSPLAARLTSSTHDVPLASPPHDDNVRQRRRRLAIEKLATENGFSVERKRARARRIEERQ